MKSIYTALLACAVSLTAMAEGSLDYSASLVANGSTGDFAPYMIGSWQGGRFTQKTGIALDLKASSELDLSHRFSWGAGVEAIGMFASGADYDRYNYNEQEHTGTWGIHRMGPNVMRLQQLWGQIKFRGVYLLAGMKERRSYIVNNVLSSGDLIRSNNARPIPGISGGFIDFQDIPFTYGWVKIDGEIMYGKLCDSGWRNGQYNFYNYMIATDIYYTYKRCYFWFAPRQPFNVIAGMQSAGQFGGTSRTYIQGRLHATDTRPFRIRDLWDMFFPFENGTEGFYKGNSLGSWDFRADWKFCKSVNVAAYFEWPFEDGSAIGRRNGWDGVWGLEVRFPKFRWLNTAVVELLDFTSQSGPMHWAPGDYAGTTITTEATGADNYFNNDFYGPYTNFGMCIGSAFLKAPLYNQDGYPAFANNRARGFHAGISGSITPEISYRAMTSAQWAWGNGRHPSTVRRRDFSAMVEATWDARKILPGLGMRLQIAGDRGSLRGNNLGALLSVSYSGNFGI